MLLQALKASQGDTEAKPSEKAAQTRSRSGIGKRLRLSEY